jgi:hypothetical protein
MDGRFALIVVLFLLAIFTHNHHLSGNTPRTDALTSNGV